MFQRFHTMRDNRERGFTLIELLVVIIIIAILAAIAIPVFLRQREKGWVSQMQSALKNGATAMESYATENDGSYANATVGNLQTQQGLRVAPQVNFSIESATAGAFCLQATHDSLPATTIWRYNSNVGEPEEASCAAAPAP